MLRVALPAAVSSVALFVSLLLTSGPRGKGAGRDGCRHSAAATLAS